MCCIARVYKGPQNDATFEAGLVYAISAFLTWVFLRWFLHTISEDPSYGEYLEVVF